MTCPTTASRATTFRRFLGTHGVTLTAAGAKAVEKGELPRFVALVFDDEDVTRELLKSDRLSEFYPEMLAGIDAASRFVAVDLDSHTLNPLPVDQRHVNYYDLVGSYDPNEESVQYPGDVSRYLLIETDGSGYWFKTYDTETQLGEGVKASLDGDGDGNWRIQTLWDLDQKVELDYTDTRTVTFTPKTKPAPVLTPYTAPPAWIA